MKTFQSFISESFQEKKVGDLVFHYYKNYIPISTPMMDRIFTVKRQRVYHIAGTQDVKNIFRLQDSKSKKSISALTKLKDTHSFLYGIESAGGILLELEADVLLEYNRDIFTEVDSNGRRWVDAKEILGNVITDQMAKLKLELIIYAETVLKLPGEWGTSWKALGYYLSGQGLGKLKSTLIKKYIDGVEQILKPHVEKIRKRAIQENDATYNELVVNNITVKRALVSSKIDAAHLFRQRNIPVVEIDPDKPLAEIRNKLNSFMQGR